MFISSRWVSIWTLIFLLCSAQVIHAAHQHDNDHSSNGLVTFDCSVCLVDHFDHHPGLDVEVAINPAPQLALIHGMISCCALRTEYTQPAVRAPPFFL
jgi:hypothetical protein